MDNKIKMGASSESWGGKSVKNVTLCVTESCNLKCKYCYMTGKNSIKKMTFEVAKSCIDYILENRSIFNEECVIWDFIGGEPLLEMELIDKITDYIKIRTYELNHPWFNKYRLNFSSNGILYNHTKVQKYIDKNKTHISIGLSVDGNKEKHDLQRIKVDGSGSYDDVVRNVDLWLEQFPGSNTKATFSHGDLKYLKDSIINLWNLGIEEVAANVVFEDVWDGNDPIIFEEQLKDLGDYIIENKLWNKYTVSFFDPYKGFPLLNHELKSNTCGAGKMLAIDCDGNFYPCVRFLDFSLENRNGRKIGDVVNGISLDKMRPFLELNLCNQNDEKCLECDVATGCIGCAGFNYDCFGTIYKRATYICEMHKANVRANKYFWDRLEKITKVESPRSIIRKERMNANELQKYMIFITSDQAVSHCIYDNGGDNVMSESIFKRGLEYCKKNSFMPVILDDNKNLFNYDGENTLTIMGGINRNININGISVLDGINSDIYEDKNISCIINLNKGNLYNLSNYIEKIATTYNRINIIIKDIMVWNKSDIEKYSKELDRIVDTVAKSYKSGKKISINVLTDLLDLEEHNRCSAGVMTYALAPNGKIYMCPATYFRNADENLGDLQEGIKKDFSYEFKSENLELCSGCEAYHCKNCKALNQLMTEEAMVSPEIQCLISSIEKEKSRELQEILLSNNLVNRRQVRHLINKHLYRDPIEFKKMN
ncbi:MAG: radical SAM peptide maturase, CXXX-repeat target family [Clostridium sp.]|uniref:radical SAM peptide maturase, CXXX-repeat target family n=1 Tax=Clostridium sp. TaxID=1506 RepID=UPI003062EEA1